MDFEQLMGTILLCIVVGFPIFILILGPIIGGKKVELRDLVPPLIKAVDDYKRLSFIRKENYSVFEEDIIALLYTYVANSNVFRPDEKLLLTKEIIGILIRPYLKKIYESKE